MESFNSLSVNKLLYSLRFFELKFSLCFSASSLMVINSFLPFCLEFLEKFLACSSVIVFFLSVNMELSFERCFIGIVCCLPAIFMIISQMAFGLVE